MRARRRDRHSDKYFVFCLSIVLLWVRVKNFSKVDEGPFLYCCFLLAAAAAATAAAHLHVAEDLKIYHTRRVTAVIPFNPFTPKFKKYILPSV